ncbi:MAG: Gfo/Idh/MocA family oxidoreductase [bacterium]|jgi:predicted dehydrogenase|nr:Gfo/Idh/MocA family oxidoreductase [bacterium]MDD3806243.1 Gfo/Idh/MocA family oxidoreductase [bacterium]MDD4152276.1 Gfo/Idh/MocA family oxidoreductase [bacterium]MDD4558778.1 Gfo/Idh/MocA family oxidoreductase [bacterium]
MVKWGIIGCGGIARRRMVPALAECKDSKVVAVMDVDKRAADEVAGQIGARAFYTEAGLLADPEIEAVYIATPVFLHHRQVLQAAAAGKHIMVEKPISISVTEAEAMINACRQAGIYFTEGYMMKYHALNVKAREMVQAGEIGPVVFARAQLGCWYPDMPGAWRQDPKLGGGGALIDMATHCYDLLQYIIGSKIKEVFAFTDTLTFKYPVDDSSTTMLKFENGAQAVVDAFFNVPDSAGQGKLELYGNKGSIQAEGTIGQASTGRMAAYLSDDAQAYDPQQSKDSLDVDKREVAYSPVNMYAAEMDYLSQCIEKRQAPTMSTGEEGLFILKVANAAYESGKTGCKIEVR